MANYRYFATCENEIVKLDSVWHDGHVSHAPSHFSGKCSKCGARHNAERKIERPGMSSNHKCDGRCESAKGNKCECSCGGKNHGRNNCVGVVAA